MASSFKKSRCFILPLVSFCPGLPYATSSHICDVICDVTSADNRFVVLSNTFKKENSGKNDIVNILFRFRPVAGSYLNTVPV